MHIYVHILCCVYVWRTCRTNHNNNKRNGWYRKGLKKIIINPVAHQLLLLLLVFEGITLYTHCHSFTCIREYIIIIMISFISIRLAYLSNDYHYASQLMTRRHLVNGPVAPILRLMKILLLLLLLGTVTIIPGYGNQSNWSRKNRTRIGVNSVWNLTGKWMKGYRGRGGAEFIEKMWIQFIPTTGNIFILILCLINYYD